MKTENPSFLSELFAEFTAIDLSGYVKILKHANNAAYLPWSNGWQILMERYAESTDEYQTTWLDNKSAEVTCKLTIIDGERKAVREQSLPVMDGKNNSVIDPTTRAINDTRARCLVKCLSKFGLGLYLYSGDELPRLESAPDILVGNVTSEQIESVTGLLVASGADQEAFLRFFKIESLEDMPKAKFKNAMALLESKIKKLGGGK
jgi:hypothetical protein